MVSPTQVPTASPVDAVRTVTKVVLPVVARGAIVRRPHVVNLLQRLDADTHAVREMRRLRERYGPGPVQLRLPGRRLTLLLEPEHVHRVLDGSPQPFAPDTREKRGALGHFQPHGVLVSAAADREHRRPFNEAVLQPGKPVHDHGAAMARVVEDEVEALLGHVDFTGTLDWDAFVVMWMRVVRRVVLGDSARDDDGVTDDLLRLRKDANWSFFKPRRDGVRRRFLRRLEEYVARAEPGSLAQLVAATPARPGTEPVQQIPQWMFAFDAGTWATFRALALVATFPGAVEEARAELSGSPDLPYLRSCVLESLRLWPTTPAILRDTTETTQWEDRTLPAGASLLIFAPFFHRDESRVSEAHGFHPELWLRERGNEDWPLVPFSGGPGFCPGRNVVLLTASAVLGRLLADHRFTLQTPRLSVGQPLPGTLSPFALRFSAAGPSTGTMGGPSTGRAA